MTRDEVIANFKETLCFFKTHFSVDRFTIDSMEKAISDMETLELIVRVLELEREDCDKRMDKCRDESKFDASLIISGQQFAFAMVKLWLRDLGALRAESQRLGIEEES